MAHRHTVAFPDLRVVIEDIVAEGSTVGLWYTVEGTHRGEEARFVSDLIGLLRQLGATVAPPAEGAPR